MKVPAMSKLAAAVGLVALTLGVLPAQATIQLSLDTPNAALIPYPGPYGTVDITRLTNTTATLTFTALAGFTFGANGAIDANINKGAGSIVTSNVLFTSAFGGSSINPPGGVPMQADGFGVFNTAWDMTNGYGSSITSFSFNVSVAGASWLADSDVLTANSQGSLVAAHVFVCNTNPCSAPGAGGGSAVVTGYAADGGFPSSSTVLEPNSASLALLALGLLGAGFWTRRKA